MEVEIDIFPEMKIAAIEHIGSPTLEYETVRKLIEWKLENHLLYPLKYRSYGIHYTDPSKTPPSKHRVDFCLSFEGAVKPNPYGIVEKVIPRFRCAHARDIGSRSDNMAAAYLYETWLPQSGESPSDFPIFFHYVNVWPTVRQEDMITDCICH